MPSINIQSKVCNKYGVETDVPADNDKLGIALNTLDQKPLNGLRHPADSGTCGWYIWGGETFPTEDDAFSPLHVSHVSEYCPDAIQFLGLPPGWRFLTDGEYEDVWEDPDLLDI